jgi:hypothetical protein
MAKSAIAQHNIHHNFHPFQVMTNASLPSTLVKCLYLFFDLPELEPSSTTDSEEYSPKERRLLLQKMFIQVLLRLCTHQPAVEELARNNVMWRKTSADILLTISRHSLSQPVISYLHGKQARKSMQMCKTCTHIYIIIFQPKAALLSALKICSATRTSAPLKWSKCLSPCFAFSKTLLKTLRLFWRTFALVRATFSFRNFSSKWNQE